MSNQNKREIEDRARAIKRLAEQVKADKRKRKQDETKAFKNFEHELNLITLPFGFGIADGAYNYEPTESYTLPLVIHNCSRWSKLFGFSGFDYGYGCITKILVNGVSGKYGVALYREIPYSFDDLVYEKEPETWIRLVACAKELAKHLDSQIELWSGNWPFKSHGQIPLNSDEYGNIKYGGGKTQ